jgi:7-cyano-7-deazaguanine synthase
MSKKVVALVSGGMDSTVLLHWLTDQSYEIKAIAFNYGQKHNTKELECMKAQCSTLGVEYNIVDLTSLKSLLRSALTDPNQPVPEGHYAAENMKQTVVPNRNMIMTSIAAGYAISLKYDSVAYAAHQGDHAIYPDCRQVFASAVDTALRLADWHEVGLLRPFVALTKSDIATIGQRLDVDWAQTWSCYKGGDIHCGKCGTCVERQEAFHLAGINDPTPYEEVLRTF